MTDTTESTAPGDSGESPADTSPPPEPKWIRLRRSCLVRADKITQVGIQRRDDDFFLEVRADREILVPVSERGDALRALEAIHAGASDVTEWTVPRSFMEE